MSSRNDRSPASPGGSDDALTGAAGAFLAQVLGLETSSNGLAELRNDLSAIKRDQNAAIYTIQLDSTVGPAAFLVYAFVLDARGGDGKSGREMYEAGVRTLEDASARNTPGPRAVANAETDDFGFILATTPGTYRALTRSQPEVAATPPPPEPPVPDRTEEAPAPARPRRRDQAPLAPPPARRAPLAPEPPAADNDAIRSKAADRLFALLQEANDEARTWLNALVAASKMESDVASDDDLIAFNTAETALALHVLDDENVSALLRALNLLVAGAEQRARSGLKTEPDD
jgi:hypothetical protein